MADEQPQSPSAEPAVSDAPASEPRSGTEEPRSEESRSFFSRLFKRGRGDLDESLNGRPDQPEEDPASKKVVLTPEELDRKIQAETDRREARRAAREAAEQRKRLRDEDPWAYAEQERLAEQHQAADANVTSLFTNIGSEHDKVAIDPLVHALPEKERSRILGMDKAGVGLEGRKLIVTEALKTLEGHWKAEGARDAEKKLRANPAFRKQVLAEARGQAVEPDLLPAVSASESDRTVSALLRGHYRMG